MNAGATATAPVATPGPRGWRRHRSAALIGAALVAATIAAVLGSGGQQYSGRLDPENAKPAGARAIAQVLRDQGIALKIVRDSAAFAEATIDDRTTVLITGTENLGKQTADQVLQRTLDADVIVVDPALGVADLLGIEEGARYSGTRTVSADCADGRFAGLSLETRRGSAFASADQGCFPVDGGSLLIEPVPGILVLGAADLFSNEQVTRSENAAVALRLLGHTDRLVWYLPDPGDLAGGDAVSLDSLLPRWIGPGLLIVCVCVLSMMLWRGRRLGPLATEPLPVKVTAIETTRSRGRLYRKSNDRGHAATALRHATRIELCEQLLLPRRNADDLSLLVGMLTPLTTLDPLELRALLDPHAPAPSSDRELITLANDLAALTREVRRS